jgi:microcystin degradation protein MlrC
VRWGILVSTFAHETQDLPMSIQTDAFVDVESMAAEEQSPVTIALEVFDQTGDYKKAQREGEIHASLLATMSDPTGCKRVFERYEQQVTDALRWM